MVFPDGKAGPSFRPHSLRPNASRLDLSDLNEIYFTL
jgi:hypothetical protein